MKNILWITFFLFFKLNALADCSSPAAIAGAIEYFTADKTHKYCNGSDWVVMKKGGLKETGRHDFSLSDYVDQVEDLSIDGNYIYLIGKKLTVLDISNPQAPTIISSYSYPGQVILKVDNYIHLYNQTDLTYRLLDATNPLAITEISSLLLPSAGNVRSAVVDNVNDYVYFASNSADRIFVVDFSSSASAFVATTIIDGVNLDGPIKLVRSANYLYSLNEYGNTVAVIDISVPSISFIADNFNLTGYTTSVKDMEILNNHLYITRETYNPNLGIISLDATDPLNIVFKGGSPDYSRPSGVKAYGGTLYMTTTEGGNHFLRFDGSDKSVITASHSNYIFNYIYYTKIDVNANWVVSLSTQMQELTIFDNSIKPVAAKNVVGSYWSGEQATQNWGQMTHLEKVGNKVALRFTNGANFVFDVSDRANIAQISSTKTSFVDIPNSYGDGFDFDGSYLYKSFANSPSPIEIVDIITDPNNPKSYVYINSAISGPRDIIADGNYLYVASANNDRLVILDITNPTSPLLHSSVSDSVSLDYISTMTLAGNYIYAWGLFSSSKYLTAIDISDKANPVVVSSLIDSSFNSVHSLACNLTHCYMSLFASTTIKVIDISDPANMSVAHSFDCGFATAKLNLVGSNLYIGGFKSYDITTPTAPVQIHTFNPGLSGWIPLVEGNTLYLGTNYLRTYDIVNPTTYNILDEVSYSGSIANPVAVDVIANKAFVLNSSGSIAIIDVTTKNDPKFNSSYAHSDLVGAKDLKITGNYGVALAASKLLIYDFSNPTSPSLTGSLDLATELGGAHRLFIDGNYAYVTAKLNSRFTIVDITNKSSPSLVSSTSHTSMTSPENLKIISNLAYIVSSGSRAISIFDITNKAAPTFLGSLSDMTRLNSPVKIDVSGNFAYVAAENSVGGGVFDISDPANIVSKSNLSNNFLEDVLAYGNYLYAKNRSNGYHIIDASNPDIPIAATNPASVRAAASSVSFTNTVHRGDYLYFINDNRLEILGFQNVPFSYNYSKIFNYSHTLSNASEIVKSGNYIYTITSNSLFSVYQDSGAGPVHLKDYSFDYYKNNGNHVLYVEGNYLYIYETYTYSIGIFDISDPLAITNLSYLSSYTNIGAGITRIRKNGNNLYLSGDTRIVALDITNPLSPVFLSKYNSTTELSYNTPFEIVGSYIIACSSNHDALQVFDISNPSAMTLAFTLTDISKFNACEDLTIDGNYLYIYSYLNTTVSIVDISNPLSLSVVSSLSSANFSTNIAKLFFANDTLFVRTSWYIYPIDVTNKLAPAALDTINFTGQPHMVLDGANIYLSISNNLNSLFKYQFDKIIPLGSCTQAGSLNFDETINVLTFCNGSSILPLATSGAGGAGCSSPAGAKGSLNFLTPSNIYQFCDGTDWINL